MRTKQKKKRNNVVQKNIVPKLSKPKPLKAAKSTESSKAAWIESIDSLGYEDKAVAGEKGAVLCEMKKIGLPVPDCFILSCACFEAFITKTGLKSEIFKKLTELDVSDIGLLQKTSIELQGMISQAEIPKGIREEIIAAYHRINETEKKKDASFVSIRSSMHSKDQVNAVFPGQHCSFINVQGDEQVLHAVKVCWASLYTPKAIVFRERNNLSHENATLAVILQQMINATSSGIVFTADASANDSGRAIVEAIYGFGEPIFSGSVKPDTYIVEKPVMRITERINQEQQWMIRRDPSGKTIKMSVPNDKKTAFVLSDSQVLRLVELGIALEKRMGLPQAIEWAEENNKLYMLHSRPIRLLSARKQIEYP